MAFAVVVAVCLRWITAPYGRHARSGFGPRLPARWAWCVMEAVTLLGFGWCFLGAQETNAVGVLFLVLYGGHYLYRSFIYPWIGPPGAAQVPVFVVSLAVLFNVINSTVLGGTLYVVTPIQRGLDLWLVSGTVLFVVGFVVHVRADAILRSLRRDHGPGYHIPKGFLYRWVSCPNYLGEIVQWCGFAVAMQSLAGWTFVVWTISNLLPRAVRHHQWYRERFTDYPASRRALVPGLL